MSGGSLDYLYSKIENHIYRITQFGQEHKNAKWLAFSKHLLLVSKALKECEWTISGDNSPDGADEAISQVITNYNELKAVKEELQDTVEWATSVLKKM